MEVTNRILSKEQSHILKCGNELKNQKDFSIDETWNQHLYRKEVIISMTVHKNRAFFPTKSCSIPSYRVGKIKVTQTSKYDWRPE